MNAFVGKRLAEERKRLRLNQDAFAEQGGVKRAAQVNYEGGKRSPDTDYLERVAQIGVDVLYVITGRRLSSDSDEVPETLSNPESPVKTRGYDESEPEAENRNAVPISGLELEPDEAQWLEWYRQIKPEDRKLVEPVVRGFADRGKGQQIKDAG